MTTDIQPFDFSVNLLQALLWQYNEAVNLQTLLEDKSAWLDQNQRLFWENWFRDVFDLKTANDFGLSVWSIILGQPLYVTKGPDNKPTWGFEEFYVNFERGNFSSNTGSSQRLSTETARILLRLRYYQLTTAGTVPEINRALADVFADYATDPDTPPAFLNDNHDMTQFYTFQFPLPSNLIFLFNNFDVLPRPSGVGSSYRVIVGESWGFDAYHENFDNGNFSEL